MPSAISSNSTTNSIVERAAAIMDQARMKEDPNAEIAQKLIRANLPDYIPSSYRDKPFYEIANLKNKEGKLIGLDGIRDAWLKAQSSVTIDNPLFRSDDGQHLRDILVQLASLSSGSGYFDSQIQNFMLGIDRYGKSMLMPNIELNGPTFFSRPRLCMQSSNLRNNPVMAPLDTFNPSSISFAIRFLLDTNLTNPYGANYGKLTTAVENCPLINPESAFFTPLSNALTSISGFPDYEIMTEATEGGWFSEQQQYVTGANDFNQGGTVSCSFREMPGGIISAIFFYWLEYMRCVARGDMLAYADDIDGQIMNYTVSIYSFNMDPSYQYITKWVKCTGCFPKNIAIGTSLNKNQDGYAIDTVKNYEVTFIVNKFEYMNPLALLDFNTLAARYCPGINDLKSGSFIPTDEFGTPPTDMNRLSIPNSPFANFCGIPYIVSDPNGYRLTYRESKKDLFADPIVRKLIACDIARTEKEWTIGKESTFELYQKYAYGDFHKNYVEPLAGDAAKGVSDMYSFSKLIEDIQSGKFMEHISQVP